jgi:hypothetical protein
MKFKLRYCWRVSDWVLRLSRSTGPCNCLECNDAREAQAVRAYVYSHYSYV